MWCASRTVSPLSMRMWTSPKSLLPAAMIEGEKAPVRFRITLLEYLGSERILHGVIEGGRFDGKKVVSRIATAQSFEELKEIIEGQGL